MSDINFTPKFSTKIEVTTSGEGSIKSISLNGNPVLPDENGNVDLDLFFVFHATYDGNIQVATSGSIGIDITKESVEELLQALKNGKIIYFDLTHTDWGNNTVATRFSCSMHTFGIVNYEGEDCYEDMIIFNGRDACLIRLSVWSLRSLEGEILEYDAGISVEEI